MHPLEAHSAQIDTFRTKCIKVHEMHDLHDLHDLHKRCDGLCEGVFEGRF